MALRGHQVNASAAPTLRVLVVTIAGMTCALPADCVQGVLTPAEAGDGDALTMYGQTYPRVDLAGRWALSSDTEQAETRVVLLSHGRACGHLRVAKVHGLAELEQTQMLPLPLHFRGEERTWYQGMILWEAGVAVLLHPGWVIEGRGAGERTIVLGATSEAPARTALRQASPC